MSICKDCSNKRNRGDFIICAFWGKIIATWNLGFTWRDIQCTVKNKPLDEGMNPEDPIGLKEKT